MLFVLTSILSTTAVECIDATICCACQSRYERSTADRQYFKHYNTSTQMAASADSAAQSQRPVQQQQQLPPRDWPTVDWLRQALTDNITALVVCSAEQRAGEDGTGDRAVALPTAVSDAIAACSDRHIDQSDKWYDGSRFREYLPRVVGRFAAAKDDEAVFNQLHGKIVDRWTDHVRSLSPPTRREIIASHGSSFRVEAGRHRWWLNVGTRCRSRVAFAMGTPLAASLRIADVDLSIQAAWKPPEPAEAATAPRGAVQETQSIPVLVGESGSGKTWSMWRNGYDDDQGTNLYFYHGDMFPEEDMGTDEATDNTAAHKKLFRACKAVVLTDAEKTTRNTQVKRVVVEWVRSALSDTFGSHLSCLDDGAGLCIAFDEVVGTSFLRGLLSVGVDEIAAALNAAGFSFPSVRIIAAGTGRDVLNSEPGSSPHTYTCIRVPVSTAVFQSFVDRSTREAGLRLAEAFLAAASELPRIVTICSNPRFAALFAEAALNEGTLSHAVNRRALYRCVDVAMSKFRWLNGCRHLREMGMIQAVARAVGLVFNPVLSRNELSPENADVISKYGMVTDEVFWRDAAPQSLRGSYHSFRNELPPPLRDRFDDALCVPIDGARRRLGCRYALSGAQAEMIRLRYGFLSTEDTWQGLEALASEYFFSILLAASNSPADPLPTLQCMLPRKTQMQCEGPSLHPDSSGTTAPPPAPPVLEFLFKSISVKTAASSLSRPRRGAARDGSSPSTSANVPIRGESAATHGGAAVVDVAVELGHEAADNDAPTQSDPRSSVATEAAASQKHVDDVRRCLAFTASISEKAIVATNCPGAPFSDVVAVAPALVLHAQCKFVSTALGVRDILVELFTMGCEVWQEGINVAVAAAVAEADYGADVVADVKSLAPDSHDNQSWRVALFDHLRVGGMDARLKATTREVLADRLAVANARFAASRTLVRALEALAAPADGRATSVFVFFCTKQVGAQWNAECTAHRWRVSNPCHWLTPDDFAPFASPSKVEPKEMEFDTLNALAAPAVVNAPPVAHAPAVVNAPPVAHAPAVVNAAPLVNENTRKRGREGGT
jgi:hypothetical protein